MIEAKKCKGHGKAKGFDACGTLTRVDRLRYGLCGDCYIKWLLNTPEGKEKIQKSKITAKKKVEQSKKKETRRKKQEVTDYSKKLQSKVNEIARLIDKGLPCLARECFPQQMHGGHIFSRGAFPSMRYNLHNVHRQSAQSNHFGNDDGLLREKLSYEYGFDYFDWLGSLRRTPALKFTNKEYCDLYRNACRLVNDLKRKGLQYTKQERIELRNLYNKKLNIYSIEFCNYKK